MKRICILLFAATLLCSNAFAKADKQVVTFYVELHCQDCIDKIHKGIAFERGVKDLQCNLKTQTVIVTYDAKKTDIPTLQKAFATIKKPASPVPVEYAPQNCNGHHKHNH